MLPRIATVLQLRAKYSSANKDYRKVSRAIDSAEISLGVNNTLAGSYTRDRRLNGRQGLNTVNDTEGDDEISGGRRGRNRRGREYEDPQAARAEDWYKSKQVREAIKGVRAQILFRKIPVALSRIERLLKRKGTGTKKRNAGNKAAALPVTSPKKAGSLPPAAVEDPMLDMMFMGSDLELGGGQPETSLTTSEDQSAGITAQAADNFLFSSDSAPMVTKMATPLHAHTSLANITRFLEALSYFESQRQVFNHQQQIEYRRARAELERQLASCKRELQQAYGRTNRHVMRQARHASFGQFCAEDQKYDDINEQLQRLDRKVEDLRESIIARPYTSARLWNAILKFPTDADPSLRIPYTFALSKMLVSIMQAVSERGSDNCINTESPRFVSGGGKGSRSVAGWLPSTSKNVTELLLLSLVRQAREFTNIANERAHSPSTFPSSAAVSMLAEALVRCQRVASALLAAVANKASHPKPGSHEASVLALVHPTLTNLDAAMMRATSAMTSALLGGKLESSPRTAGLLTAGNTAEDGNPSAIQTAAPALVEKVTSRSALLLVSRMYKLQCFSRGSSSESMRLLYLLIQKAFPQLASKTRLGLSTTDVERKRLEDFATEKRRKFLLRKGASLRDAADDPKHEARLERRRMTSLLLSKRLATKDHEAAEMIGLSTPFNDLCNVYECLSFAKANTSEGASIAANALPLDATEVRAGAFKPTQVMPSWNDVLSFSLPHVGEAIIARSAADKSLSREGMISDASAASGLNLPQLIHLLYMSSSMIGEALRSKPKKGDGSSANSSAAFYQFLISEIKVRMSGRLKQESSREVDAQHHIRQKAHRRLAAAENNIPLTEVTRNATTESLSFPSASPGDFVGLVTLTGAIVASAAPSNPLRESAKEVQQICKGLVIEDKQLVAELQGIFLLVEGGNGKAMDNQKDHPRAAKIRSDEFAQLVEGFRSANMLSEDFYQYLLNTF